MKTCKYLQSCNTVAASYTLGLTGCNDPIFQYFMFGMARIKKPRNRCEKTKPLDLSDDEEELVNMTSGSSLVSTYYVACIRR